ncbi:MAG: hypothetical protein SGARI_003313 [Bacillariaceae sp.]
MGIDDFHFMLFADNSPILKFYEAFTADYRRHIARIITWGEPIAINRIQERLDEAMEELKETWDFKEKLSSIELTGTYAAGVDHDDQFSQWFMLAAPDHGPRMWLHLYSDACRRYGHAAAEIMYPMIDGQRTLGLKGI